MIRRISILHINQLIGDKVGLSSLKFVSYFQTFLLMGTNYHGIAGVMNTVTLGLLSLKTLVYTYLP